MSDRNKRVNVHSTAGDLIWVAGTIVVTGLVVWLPYWIWNVAGAASGPWWRVPAVTPGVFDSYVYLHWMGAAVQGLAYGGHLKWFGVILSVIWKLIGSWASLPELWIVSRWLTSALLLWTAPWCVRRWSGLGVWPSRAIALGLWLALLPISMRPGIYSWYLPFVLLGLACAPLVNRKLRAGHPVQAAGISLIALALTWTYPWFFMPVGLWLATIWLAAWTRRSVWILPVILFIASVVAFLAAVPLARWFLDPAQAGLVGMYERNGMTFARVPFFANTVLALLAWPALLWSALRLRLAGEARGRSLVEAAWAWIVVLLLWFNTPFTGISIYSDHFIAITVALAWLTLASVWEAVREPVVEAPPSIHPKWLAFIVSFVPTAVAAGASLVFVYILRQPLLRNIWRFDSYVVHLAHWLALALAGWLLVWRERRRAAVLPPRVAAGALLIAALGLGLGATAPVVLRDIPNIQAASSKIPVTDWIRSRVPSGDKMCADPASASYYAAHTGRRVTPAEATLSYPDASDAVIRDLETLAGAYAVASSGNAAVFRFAADHYRTIPCAEGSEYAHNAFWFKLLRRLGFGASRANELIGCRQTVIDANWARVNAAIERHALDARAFGELCEWVIVPDGERGNWQFPAGYAEERAGSDTSIWRRI